jgi:DNA-binding response OmpR family regulator/DNA-binding CsgD family transcriptional regulator
VVLIVDDDADTRAMLSDFAAAEGYVPEVTASGEEALRAIAARLPDLILLDAVMPELDGFETCRRIKAREGGKHIPVIFMTGLTETEHVVQGLSAGGVDYVTKPLVLDELAARIRVHLDNARTTRSAIDVLDSVGARLLACDASGRIGWSSPGAQGLLDTMDLPSADSLRSLLREFALGHHPDTESAAFDCGGLKFSVTPIGAAAADQMLFKLARSSEGIETQVLQQAFRLTPREADVLLWTARGKSNKDMSEILNISARTVNKHLEQIFIKIGVENRASAASAATRVLLET